VKLLLFVDCWKRHCNKIVTSCRCAIQVKKNENRAAVFILKETIYNINVTKIMLQPKIGNIF